MMLGKKLLKFVVICFCVFLCVCPLAEAAVSTGYTYIEVDNARSKWGDWNEPEHLKYFGLAMADVTGDGCKDIVSGRYVYLNPGGDMTGKWQRVDFGLNVDGMLFVNVDDDDFGDVIAEALPNVYWLEAEDTKALHWRATKIGTLPKTGHINGQGYILAQIVAGGKPEIVLSCGEGVYYFEIPANPKAGNWPRTHISPNSSEEGIGAGDIDGDGDIDIAVGISREGMKKGEAKTVAWLENPGNGKADWNIYPVGTTVYFADRFAVAEVNGDGKADIVVTEESGLKHGASVYWFGQPTDCKQPNWPRHTVTVQNTTNNLDVADIDNDGDIDIITAEHRGTKKLQIFENDGKANFTEHVIDKGKESHLGARVADLDNDGDADIVSIAWDDYKFLHVWRNDAVSAVPVQIPFEHSIIDSNGPHKPYMKMTGDVDGDGHADIIIGGSKGPLVWYRWPNWDKAIISQGGYSTVDGAFGDVDGDGDDDIVMGGLVWYENPRPIGCPAEKLWKTHKIAEHPTHDVRVADLDRNGRLDIVARNQSGFGRKAGNKIYIWLQNNIDTWGEHVINCPHGEGVVLSDIDDDGDKDILIGGIWFENTKDIDRGVWKKHKFASWHADAMVQTADINGDGRLDVVLAPAELKGDYYRISWFQAPSNPKTGKWVEHVIEDHIECIIHALATVDINGDGLVDIVAAEMHQGTDPDVVAAYINKDKGLAWAKQVLSDKGSHCIRAADFDNDGDPDIIGANHAGSYQVIEMWENKSKSIRQVRWKHLSSQNRHIPLPNVGRSVASARDTEKKTVDLESLAGHITCDLYQPDFLYGDCAYTGVISASDGKIYFFVSSHNSDYAARFYSFDPASQKITFIAEMDKVLGEDAKKQISHGKVHTQIFEHKNKLWFATHISYYKNGLPNTDYRGKIPYSGGHFVSYDLQTGEFTDLAHIFGNEGIIVMTMDKRNEILYGMTWTTGILVSYDIKNNDLRYWGAVQKMGEWGHRGGTEWDMICRTLAIDPSGFVYGSTMDGAIWKYDSAKARRVNFIKGLDLSRVPFSQSAKENTRGDFKNGWRTIEWNEKTNSFWGLHFHCTTLFEFDPAANYIRAVDELRAGAYRGMPTNPETSQLGFMVGPENTIFYLADGPAVKMKGRRGLRCNLYLITYEIDKQKYTDHGPILSKNGRRVFFGESIVIGADDHIYSVAWVEVADKKRVQQLRAARTKGAPAETARAVYEMLLVRLPRWQQFVK